MWLNSENTGGGGSGDTERAALRFGQGGSDPPTLFNHENARESLKTQKSYPGGNVFGGWSQIFTILLEMQGFQGVFLLCKHTYE